MSTAENLLIALGFQLPEEFPPLCDKEAVLTARLLIMGELVDNPWVQRLNRWSSSLEDLVLAAGRAAPITRRPDTTMIRTSWNPLRIYGAVATTGSRWVASGWTAAAVYGGTVSPQSPLVIYVDGGMESLGLALPNDPAGIYEVHILPFDGVSEQGAQSADGIVWADPYQAALDLCADSRTKDLGVELIAILEENGG